MKNIIDNNARDAHSQYIHMQNARLKDQYAAQARAQAVSKSVAKAMQNHMVTVIDHMNDPNYDLNGAINVVIEHVISELHIKDCDLRIASAVARAIADAMVKAKK